MTVPVSANAMKYGPAYAHGNGAANSAEKPKRA